MMEGIEKYHGSPDSDTPRSPGGIRWGIHNQARGANGRKTMDGILRPGAIPISTGVLALRKQYVLSIRAEHAGEPHAKYMDSKVTPEHIMQYKSLEEARSKLENGMFIELIAMHSAS